MPPLPPASATVAAGLALKEAEQVDRGGSDSMELLGRLQRRPPGALAGAASSDRPVRRRRQLALPVNAACGINLWVEVAGCGSGCPPGSVVDAWPYGGEVGGWRGADLRVSLVIQPVASGEALLPVKTELRLRSWRAMAAY